MKELMNKETKEYIWVDNAGCQTLAAYFNLSCPAEYGNRIIYGNRHLINLNAENLRYLLDNGIISYPIKLQIIDDRTLLAVDKRIPPDFLINQRVQDEKFRENSTYQFTVSGDGYVLMGYKGKEIWTEGYINCPYIPDIKNV